MTKPILIYKGDDICHNVLTVFAEEFGNALEQMGKNVIYFDMAKEPIGNVTRYMNQHFCAIIGVQSYMFSIKLSDEKLIYMNIFMAPNLILFLTTQSG